MAKHRRTSRPPEKKKKQTESDHNRSSLDELNDAFNQIRASHAGLPDVTNAIHELFGGIRKLSGKRPDQLFEFNFQCVAEFTTLLMVRMRIRFRRNIEGMDLINPSEWDNIPSSVVDTLLPLFDSVSHMNSQAAAAYARFRHVMSLTHEDEHNGKQEKPRQVAGDPPSNGRCQTRSRKAGVHPNKTNGRRPTRIRDSIS